jgi:hypothetical protein
MRALGQATNPELATTGESAKFAELIRDGGMAGYLIAEARKLSKRNTLIHYYYHHFTREDGCSMRELVERIGRSSGYNEKCWFVKVEESNGVFTL